MNTGVHVFFWISVFVRYIPRVGISGSYGSSIFSFLSSYGLMGSFLTQDNITITIIILFDGILITNLASRNNSKLATISFDMSPLIMKTFPILCTRFSSSLCTFHVPTVHFPYSAISPRNLSSFQWRTIFRNQHPHTRYTHCCQNITTPRFFQETRK